MVYSEVVANGMILPKKNKYTLRDVTNVMEDSLFNSTKTLTYTEAVFIVKCSAMYHDTSYSNNVKTYINDMM